MCRETNLKMNPGTEIPLDQPDAQVYYYLSRADGNRAEKTTWAGSLRQTNSSETDRDSTNSSDAGDPSWKESFCFCCPTCLLPPISLSLLGGSCLGGCHSLGTRKRKESRRSEGPRRGGRGLGRGESTEVRDPGAYRVCHPQCSQILLEAEDAKRVSQAPFLSEKDCTTSSGWMISGSIFLNCLQKKKKKKGQESGLWKQVALWAQFIIEKPLIPDTS